MTNPPSLKTHLEKLINELNTKTNNFNILNRGEAVIDKTTTKIRTSTSELCTRGIDTCTLVTMVGQILTTVCWHCGMACLAIG